MIIEADIVKYDWVSSDRFGVLICPLPFPFSVFQKQHLFWVIMDS